MEKTWSYRFLYLRFNDQNSIYSKEVDFQNWVGEREREVAWAQRKVAKISAISIEEAAFYWRIKNDTGLLVDLRTEAEANWKHERGDLKLRIDHSRVQYLGAETPKRAAILQDEIFHAEEARTTEQRREKEPIRLHQSYPTRQEIYRRRLQSCHLIILFIIPIISKTLSTLVIFISMVESSAQLFNSYIGKKHLYFLRLVYFGKVKLAP